MSRAAVTCSYPRAIGWTSVEARDWKSVESALTAVTDIDGRVR
jgi:hypothetical protein